MLRAHRYWSDAWLRCICTHTHTHTAQHSNIAVAPAVPLPSAPSQVPNSAQRRERGAASEQESDRVLLTCTAPCGSPPHRPPLPCPAMSCPFPRPGCAGSRSPTPSRPSVPSPWPGIPVMRGPPAAQRCVTVGGQAREYSRGVRWLGTRVFVKMCMGHRVRSAVAWWCRERNSAFLRILACSTRLRGWEVKRFSVGPGFPIHTPYVVLYAYRFLAFIHPSRESGAGRLSTTSWRYLPVGPRLWPRKQFTTPPLHN